MARLPTVLICDDDTIFHQAVKHVLKNRFELRSAFNSDEALAIVRNHAIQLVLLDIEMRTPDEGLRLIPKLLELDGDVAIVMSSGRTDFPTVREAMRLGASDYVPKDFEPNELDHVITRALNQKNLIQQNRQQNFETAGTQNRHALVGKSKSADDLRKIIERIKNSPANIMIYGETGTGKEVVARHLRRTLPDGTLEPFVAVDSATIQSSTAESILFGHEKGAFTGADKMTRGVFEEAHGGVVYFDELANMPLEIQAKLLRVIQEKEVRRIGSTKTLPLEFRVICATNQRLEEMIRQGRFKDDLYQRLSVLPIDIPPLRERAEDIPLLAEHFLRQQTGREQIKFSEAALQVLQQYSWPGNVRELANLVSYVVAMTDGNEIDLSELPPKFRDVIIQPSAAASGQNFYAALENFEKNLLTTEFQNFRGPVGDLALRLGMGRSHLYSKLKKYGIYNN